MSYTIEPIAYIYNDYTEKFGIPRQSCLEEDGISEIVFEDKFRDENALRGLSEYSHIWLIWLCDKAESKKEWTPTVRPPRLGGNKKMGVFATRSPFHPNRLGLSCVRLAGIEKRQGRGTVLKVKGADILSGTPIIDIKPYLSFSDAHTKAVCGFADEVKNDALEVTFDVGVTLPEDISEKALTRILSQDPRPHYHADGRIYKMNYSGYDVSFRVEDNILYVLGFISGKDGGANE